jgi:hypothetical protein
MIEILFYQRLKEDFITNFLWWWSVRWLDIKVSFPIKIGMNVYPFEYITSSGKALCK